MITLGVLKTPRLASARSCGSRALQPQRVTARGREAAVVVAAKDYDRLQPPLTGLAVVEALARSPLAEVGIERVSVEAPVRDVEL